MGKRLDVDGELEREAIKAEVGEVMPMHYFVLRLRCLSMNQRHWPKELSMPPRLA